MTRLAAVPCTCDECRALDVAHPREGHQLALVSDTGGGVSPAADHPDAIRPASRIVRAPEGRNSRDARSRPPTAESEDPPMNAQAKISTPTSVAAPVPPSTIEQVPLRDLRRAPENVRRTDIEQDVGGLSENIAAVGLLQSLIGYRVGRKREVWIVGGGRRLAALRVLLDDFRIDLAFRVPVLIRERDEAIELSLAENLERRDMNPADEFEAFRLLMEPGTRSPADIAKRFGLTEVYVKQRLKLADLAPEILDGLRAGEMTLHGALAYARAPDPTVQQQIFAAQKRRAYDRHDPRSIRNAVASTKTTDWTLYKYVGAEAYERAGGGYDEGLFEDAPIGDSRRLSNQVLVEKLARDHIDFQMIGRQREMAEALNLEAVDGFVVYPDLAFPSYGMSPPKAPEGFAWVGSWEPGAAQRMLKTVRNNGISVQLLVGIQDDRLVAWDRGFFVEKAQKNAVQPDEKPAAPAAPFTPEEREAIDRAHGIDLWSKRLAVGSFDETPLQGRAFFDDSWAGRNPASATHIGQQGWWVRLQVFVTAEQAASHTEAAGERYERAKREVAEAAEAKRIADEEAQQQLAHRRAELEAMTPPAVAVVDGEPWFRDDEHGYGTADQEGWIDNWLALIDQLGAEDIITFDTREAFDSAHAAARSLGAGA
ncbi:ParB N-terminal domain-containing protein [Sphingomonas sp. IW22]|uniref:ParB N-terminal domain-containing protein n=1 Tax=Sphingomonas sp. IW22 TaxID=3242489 RepID=UPI0035228315